MKMKKFIVISTLLTIFIATATANAEAANLHEISGVVSNVQIIPMNSFFGVPMTVVTFKDGRVVTFRGIILGMVFEIGKEHTIRYDDEWIMREIKTSKK